MLTLKKVVDINQMSPSNMYSFSTDGAVYVCGKCFIVLERSCSCESCWCYKIHSIRKNVIFDFIKK